MHPPHRASDDAIAQQTAKQKKATDSVLTVQRRRRKASAPDTVPALVEMLQKRRWHHALCMGPMPVAAAVAMWQSGADGVSGEAPVRVALDAGHPIIALAMLEATTPLALAGTAADVDHDAAADADRICRRLASHMALALRPRLVWRMIATWEVGGRRFRCKHNKSSAPTDRVPLTTTPPNPVRAVHPTRDAREMRRAWRFLLRFRLVAFLGALAKAATEAELARFWETSAPQTRVHILEIVLYHAERTLRLAERPHCQRVWAEAAAAGVVTASRPTKGRHRKTDKRPTAANAGLLPAMRGAVASLRNVALWAARA
ncbi:hypothetical protein pqer_cds_1135 [Pandoravirus quercus]|uniref:Uncharacterized protein n=2 Tax=Pandoravirus TaxID=2060084 RepID=A0A2U7UAT2_9VIRU|nr:hypothetical protein pqer_cds_1135 [Pandoravirus quercus]AVK75557.1 hypothetical protein pqer_cds_1135 [Pandoravirus quercus]QBZ81732.1 hypothetical protein pclt_cds_1150 [Pandoravirus celtis]